MSIQVLLALVSICLSLYAYYPYFRDTLSRKTKPHAISWLIWTIVMAVAFAAQVSENAGPGSWITFVGAVICVAIFYLAIKQGETKITLFDWSCLVLAMSAVPAWQTTSSALLAIIIVSFVDVMGFLPTFRKSYNAPYEETVSTYFVCGINWSIAICALTEFNAVTLTYPMTLAIIHFALAIFLTIRRSQINKIQEEKII